MRLFALSILLFTSLSLPSFYTQAKQPFIKPTFSLNGQAGYNVVEDHDGFLWFSTMFDGIVRFDGSESKTLKVSNGELSNQFVTQLLVDKRGDIWIGTNYGLNRYNKKTNTISQYYFEPDKPYTSLSDNTFDLASNTLVEDNAGYLWFGTHNGLTVYNPDSDTFKNYLRGDTAIEKNAIWSLFIDDSNIMWAASSVYGVVSIDLNGIDLDNIEIDVHESINNQVSEVKAINQDALVNIWLVCRGVSCKQGCVSSYEALVRMQSNDNGIISPDRFLPSIEKMQVMEKFTYLCIQLVVEDMQSKPEIFEDELAVSINVPVDVLCKPKFVGRLSELTKNIDSKRIVIEVTETLDAKQKSDFMISASRVRMLGYGLSIDDFGSGYSNLHRLANIPFTELKIDREYILDIQRNSKHSLLVESMIKMAKLLNIRVVVEGVETKAISELLIKLGADELQGYYYSKPLSFNALLDWKQTSSRISCHRVVEH